MRIFSFIYNWFVTLLATNKANKELRTYVQQDELLPDAKRLKERLINRMDYELKLTLMKKFQVDVERLPYAYLIEMHEEFKLAEKKRREAMDSINDSVELTDAQKTAFAITNAVIGSTAERIVDLEHERRGVRRPTRVVQGRTTEQKESDHRRSRRYSSDDFTPSEVLMLQHQMGLHDLNLSPPTAHKPSDHSGQGGGFGGGGAGGTWDTPTPTPPPTPSPPSSSHSSYSHSSHSSHDSGGCSGSDSGSSSGSCSSD